MSNVSKLEKALTKEISRYLKTLEVSPKTLTNYKSDTKHFLSWLIRTRSDLKKRSSKKIFEKISSKDIENYTRELKAGNVPVSTIKRRLSSLRHLSDYLLETEVITSPLEISDALGKRKALLPRSIHPIIPAVISLASAVAIIALATVEHSKQGVLLTSPAAVDASELPSSSPARPPETLELADGRSIIILPPPEIDGNISNIEPSLTPQSGRQSGRGTIHAGSSQATIYSKSLSEDSIILITPIGAHNIFISAQGEGYVNVSTSETASERIQFNWLLTEN